MAILEPTLILVRANAVLKELLTSPNWAASLDKGVVHRTPLLVISISPEDPVRNETRPRFRDYFIVTVQQENRISARFVHDAETGDCLEAEGVRKPGSFLRPYVEPPDASKPDAVWRPCRESTTRFLPFWRFPQDSRTMYLRADGILYSGLTTTGRG
jgi:hypothetical protein